MGTWLAVAVLAQFLYALSTLIDKRIVTKSAHIGKPIVYTFYVALLSGFVIVLAPFVSVPNMYVVVFSIVNAVTFTAAIYLLYSALTLSRASDVAPVVGGVSAIVTALLAAIFIDGDVAVVHALPILLLAGGTAVISHFHFTRKAILFTLAAGVFFGVTVLTTKILFIETSFLDGYFWMRMMNVVVALSLLLVPAFRTVIFQGGKQASNHSKGLVIGNKILGGVAAALSAFAVSIGSVALVNSLAGLQFVFLFIFAVLFARRLPLFGEKGSHGGWHTFLGVSLIVSGLAALYLT